jgi:uncharacterized protein YndB with AHSA1/START domain
MTSDIAALVGAIVRKVETRETDGKKLRVVLATATYDTDVADLWNALTDAKRIPRWFYPITGDLRLGGRYQLEGNAGGSITECEPPRRLAVTWEFGGGTSWVNVDLAKEHGGKSLLRLEHIAEVPDEMWGVYGPGAVGVGWDLGLQALRRHVDGGVLDPAETQAWSLSEEGRAFVTGCSRAWGEAAVVDGMPRDVAEKAVAATTGFYTGHAA